MISVKLFSYFKFCSNLILSWVRAQNCPTSIRHPPKKVGALVNQYLWLSFRRYLFEQTNLFMRNLLFLMNSILRYCEYVVLAVIVWILLNLSRECSENYSFPTRFCWSTLVLPFFKKLNNFSARNNSQHSGSSWLISMYLDIYRPSSILY